MSRAVTLHAFACSLALASVAAAQPPDGGASRIVDAGAAPAAPSVERAPDPPAPGAEPQRAPDRDPRRDRPQTSPARPARPGVGARAPSRAPARDAGVEPAAGQRTPPEARDGGADAARTDAATSVPPPVGRPVPARGAEERVPGPPDAPAAPPTPAGGRTAPEAAPPQPTADTGKGTGRSEEMLQLMRDAVGLIQDLLPGRPTEGAGGVIWLAAFALLVMLGATSMRRVREKLPAAGLVPRTLSLGHAALRLLAFGLVLVLVARLIPTWMGPALPWVLLAAAAALGWSARDLLPDVIAGLVITFERRIRRGIWVSGKGFSGTVEGLGLRATWLRDPRGHRVSVPNRHLLNAPMLHDSAIGAEHEVTLRIGADESAGRVRQALRDAVLLSPWVPPGATPTVLRDADAPDLWHVRSSLLEARFAPRFEGELLERAEEILAHERQRAAASEPEPDSSRQA